jgi:hypothetical protein
LRFEAQTTMPDGRRYDDDFYAWTQYQAKVLCALQCDDDRFDRAHLAEEIAAIGRRERDIVCDEMRRVLMNLLKLSYGPSDQRRYGCTYEILDARFTLEDKISPSLRRHAEAMLATVYEDARELALLGLLEVGLPDRAAKLPRLCPLL